MTGSSTPSMFDEDRRARCHVCGALAATDEIHTGHEPDCPASTTGLCRCDLPVCADCCTDSACRNGAILL